MSLWVEPTVTASSAFPGSVMLRSLNLDSATPAAVINEEYPALPAETTTETPLFTKRFTSTQMGLWPHPNQRGSNS